MGASEWLCLRQDPELAAEVIVPLRPDRNRAAQHRRGPQSLLTHRWRAGGEWIRTFSSAMPRRRRELGCFHSAVRFAEQQTHLAALLKPC